MQPHGKRGRTRLPVKSVVVTREVVDSVLTYSKAAHPREGILMLRGSNKKGVLRIDSVAIPPMATHGEGFSSFNWWMVPIDLSFVGVAHSHPSGYAVPSLQDTLHVMGKIMMIAGFPYEGVENLKVYDVHGKPLNYEVDENSAHQS
jgi:proteasome lid subunit RPN8/RPN11